ncbi:serine--tRNA ligase [Streptomyces profundus]|uniref:serine--tRNA ligase n=1 Tax=Streptomyces profundus TaxID=2867410 RepID=UPI001D169E9F|nr:serine--tRNA ligase [Streptomyces sp. MA3_2.13]UED86758.1 serine--tRNA ligase [Streptomyces sp. MA3_2.13]
MLEVTVIRADTERVRRALAKRGVRVDLSAFLALDQERRNTRTETERLRADRKRISAEVAGARRAGEGAEELQARAKELAALLTERESRLTELERECREFLDPLPNLPDEDVPAGGKERNEVLRTVGEPADLPFPAKDHVTLARSLDLVDYQRGTKLGGSGFWVYGGDGARLEWALLNYFVAAHLSDGYRFVLPPHILTHEAGYAAGQFPKFADEVFAVERGETGPERFLLPTSETALVNLHRDETLPEAELPLRYFAYSPCYRKEIGGYRSTERGTLRGHQFNKVEMFQFAHPERSDEAHDELLAKAERLVADLGLTYRVTRLAAEDTSAAMARTLDIEVLLPSVGGHVEVSSVSNARDYQARRGNIRYRPRHGRSAFVHTLNASGLATSRLMPALLEQHQREDGTVALPEVLRPWFPDLLLTPLTTARRLTAAERNA